MKRADRSVTGKSFRLVSVVIGSSLFILLTGDYRDCSAAVGADRFGGFEDCNSYGEAAGKAAPGLARAYEALVVAQSPSGTRRPLLIRRADFERAVAVCRSYAGRSGESMRVSPASRDPFSVKEQAEANGPKAYGPFSVPWGAWFSTGVHIRKGENFSVKATGAYRSVNQNTDVKFCGPGGCGYWGWFVLKAKIGNQAMDVGASGGGTALSDGVIELGSPRGSEFRPEDAKNCTGSVSVDLWIDKSR